MARVIHKYSLIECFGNITTPKAVSMPVGAEIIEVAMQGGIPHLWAIGDGSAEHANRHIVVYGTGVLLEIAEGFTDLLHLGTLHNQGFVWHVFEAV